jgi:glutathione S-transferase
VLKICGHAAVRKVLGETLSLADITAGTSLYRYFELEIDRPSRP